MDVFGLSNKTQPGHMLDWLVPGKDSRTILKVFIVSIRAESVVSTRKLQQNHFIWKRKYCQVWAEKSPAMYVAVHTYMFRAEAPVKSQCCDTVSRGRNTQVCGTFDFQVIFGHCTLRNLLLLPNFSWHPPPHIKFDTSKVTTHSRGCFVLGKEWVGKAVVCSLLFSWCKHCHHHPHAPPQVQFQDADITGCRCGKAAHSSLFHAGTSEL